MSEGARTEDGPIVTVKNGREALIDGGWVGVSANHVGDEVTLTVTSDAPATPSLPIP